MFGWLKRLFGIAQAEAHSAISKLEDPVKMTEQGIRDLKNDLNKSLQSLAEVKAMHIRGKKELEVAIQREQDYENKAILLLQKAESGEITPEEADRLASQALAKKEQVGKTVAAHKKNVQQYAPMVKKMETNVQQLKDQILSWENELKTLKARSRVSEATSKLNKQMAQIDSTDTIARLERMREKVSEQEALAESYADIADANTSIDDEIDKVLGPGAGENSDALAKLKAKMATESLKSAGNKSTESTSEGESANQGSPSGELSDLDKLKEKLKNTKEG
ncbi:PspA/IM30 family protein [Flexithrix dorotheae]|uniref:PspA/IM30 family protein n=1 Tax=Flexithrix dorotheae TaxID=70993 RepID=UPI000361B63B|nr:PspA/IM30 family protein [Flexithrix dorotheae]